MLSGGNDPVGFGLFTLLYGSPDAPFVTGADDAGRVNRLTALRRLRESQWIPVSPGMVAPKDGQPYEIGFQLCSSKPDLVIGPWNDIASMVTGDDYPAVRDGLFANHLAGYYVAKFLSHEVPKMVAHGGSFDLGPAMSKIGQMQLLRAALWSSHPEWKTRGVTWDRRAVTYSTVPSMSN